MAGLLYYVPERSQVEVTDLAELGLAHAFEGALTARKVTGQGPDGGQGVVCADAGRVPEIGFFRDRQSWLRIPGNPAGAYVGRFTGEPVRPAELARLEILPGHQVGLADGQEWLVPVARGIAEQDGQPCGYIALPRKTQLDDEGRWRRGDVAERHTLLWELACRWWDTLADGPGDDDSEADEEPAEIMDFQWCANAATAALAANYRVAAAEVSLLGLLEDQHASDVLMALVDWPTLREFLKKKQAAAD